MTKRGKAETETGALSQLAAQPANTLTGKCKVCRMSDDLLAELKKVGEMMAAGECDWGFSLLYKMLRDQYDEYDLTDYRSLERHFASCWQSIYRGIKERQGKA